MRFSRLVCTGILAGLSGAVLIAQTEFQISPDAPDSCRRYVKYSLPSDDMPDARMARSLFNPGVNPAVFCDSDALYYGYEKAADPVKARLCAYAELGQELSPLSGAAILTMIYANGNGVARNLDLALKFACADPFGGQDEIGARVSRLEQLRGSKRYESFDYCQDVLGNFNDRYCWGKDVALKRAWWRQYTNAVGSRLRAEQRKASAELQQAAEQFIRKRVGNEVSPVGSLSPWAETDEESSLIDAFIEAFSRFEGGHLPTFTPSDFTSADAELNAVYRKLMGADRHWFAEIQLTPEGVRETERAWLAYREAWVRFGKVTYPSVSAENWRAWLTRERTEELKHFPREAD